MFLHYIQGTNIFVNMKQYETAMQYEGFIDGLQMDKNFDVMS